MRNLTGKLKLLIGSCLTLLLLLNCTYDAEVDISDINGEQETNDLLNKLIQYGFKESDILDVEDHYQVQGDIMFFKNQKYNLPKARDKGSNTSLTQHRHTTQLVSQANRNISVGFHADVNNDWKVATREAMSDWNAICNVYFYETSNYSSADIQVYYGTGAPGSAGIPTASGEPGGHIKINNAGYTWTADKKITIVAHELGHTIGLLHTGGSSNIPGTPVTDDASVMYFASAGRPWSFWGFTNYDKIAARWLFPYPTLSTSAMTLNTQQPGGEISITGTGSVTVSISGGSGIYLTDGIGGPFMSTLNLTAPTNFSVYGPGIGSPGYIGGVSYVNLHSPNNGIVDVTTVTHSN